MAQAPEGPPSSEDILAAYRRRKEERERGAHAEEAPDEVRLPDAPADPGPRADPDPGDPVTHDPDAARGMQVAAGAREDLDPPAPPKAKPSSAGLGDVEAMRQRKRQQLEARRAASTETTEAPAAGASAASSPSPAAAPATAPKPAAPAPPREPAPASSAEPKPAVAPVPADPIDQPPPAAIEAGHAVIDASAQGLMQDRNVTVRGSPFGRLVGILLIAAGLAGLAWERYEASQGFEVLIGAATPFWQAAALLALVGAVVALTFTAFPTRRRLAVRFATTQVAEWKRARGRVRFLAALSWTGAALVLIGLAAAAASYAFLDAATARPAALMAAALAGFGVLLWILASLRRGMANRLYVQALVLAHLEQEGTPAGSGDGRYAAVLLALDELLGALPDAEVQRFLQTETASTYMQLIQDIRGADRGR